MGAGGLRATSIPTLSRRILQPITASHGINLQVEESPQAEGVSKEKILPRAGSMREYQKSKENWLKENRDALLIAASVIAAITYQAAFNHLRGVW